MYTYIHTQLLCVYVHLHTPHLVIYIIYISFSVISRYYILYIYNYIYFILYILYYIFFANMFCQVKGGQGILWTLHSPSWLCVSSRMFWLPHSLFAFGWKCNCTFFLILKCHDWAEPSPWAFQRQLMKGGFPISKPHQNPHNWDFPPLRDNQQFRSECNHWCCRGVRVLFLVLVCAGGVGVKGFHGLADSPGNADHFRQDRETHSCF